MECKACKAVLAIVDDFDRECAETECTDTGALWDTVMPAIRDEIARLSPPESDR